MHCSCLKNGMGVSTAVAKRVDSGSPKARVCVVSAIAGPRRHLGDDPDVPVVNLDLGIDVCDAYCRGNLPFLQCEDYFDNAGYAARGLAVSEVGLDRAD